VLKKAALRMLMKLTPAHLLHENDGRHEVGDETGEGDDALDYALDPEGENLDQVEPVGSILEHNDYTSFILQFFIMLKYRYTYLTHYIYM